MLFPKPLKALVKKNGLSQHLTIFLMTTKECDFLMHNNYAKSTLLCSYPRFIPDFTRYRDSISEYCYSYQSKNIIAVFGDKFNRKR